MSGFHSLHYCEWGSARSRRVILCVHGYSGNARDFDELACALSRDARVVCLDVAGRGDSDWLATPFAYNFVQFLADVNALVARLRVKRVDWVGTSMGGLLGMMLAAGPASPIRRLVVNDVGAFVPMDALQHIGRNLHAPARFDSLDEVEAHLRRTHREWGEIADAQWERLARHHARVLDAGGYRLHYDPAIARLMQPAFPFAPGLFFWDAWYKVRCPVLLLRGEHSSVFPPSVAATMREINARARLVEFPDCGHAPALMSREQIEPIREFLIADGRRMGASIARPSYA